jgi:hypothetical protein
MLCECGAESIEKFLRPVIRTPTCLPHSAIERPMWLHTGAELRRIRLHLSRTVRPEDIRDRSEFELLPRLRGVLVGYPKRLEVVDLILKADWTPLSGARDDLLAPLRPVVSDNSHIGFPANAMEYRTIVKNGKDGSLAPH